ncbi:MAG: helix-turn-helix domain-containing protein, partial [Candidatus Limiplasma sp.]|nr:helix-turn-helix domain-containing protein [Candidatus Limiplasma sp.]
VIGVADWVSIKAEYLVGDSSLRELAEKYGVSHNTLRKRAEREKWTLERKGACRKRDAKITQKVATKIATREVDRLTRLLGVGDLLADKLEQSARQLGAYTILKRKGDRVVEDDEGNRRVVEDTEEIAVPCESIISTADAKRIASALKDLHEIAKVSSPGKDEALSKASALLEGLPSAID